MSTPQQALVSLADAPVILRGGAKAMRGIAELLKARDPNNDGAVGCLQYAAWFESLASSLEQLHPSDSNTNSDQVTITLSLPREYAEEFAEIGGMDLPHRVRHHALWLRLIDATRAALNNSTPERRE